MSKQTHLELVTDFIRESNAIEREYSDLAFEDGFEAFVYAMGIDVMTLDSVLEIHRLLLKRLRPDIAGWWRNVEVWIGGRKCHFVSVQLIEEDLKPILETLNAANHIENAGVVLKGIPDEKKEDSAKAAHIDFERIHPFEDGNGRVGRILWQWHRLKLGLPIRVIHEGKEQWEYYKWFK